MIPGETAVDMDEEMFLRENEFSTSIRTCPADHGNQLDRLNYYVYLVLLISASPH